LDKNLIKAPFMPIDFENEVLKITNQLKFADGYLDCEILIIHEIKQQIIDGFTFADIEECLKKLKIYFDEQILKNKTTTDCTNYRYAVGFVNTLINTPYWHSWIKTINL
jgi:hypothetical protein